MNITDRSGQTPFAVALRTRDHEAAAAILAREPGAAEQVTERCDNIGCFCVGLHEVSCNSASHEQKKLFLCLWVYVNWTPGQHMACERNGSN